MPTTPKKKAYRRVVRRANGIGLRVAYFDANTGQELTSLDGYEVIDQGFLPPNTGTGNGGGDNDDDNDDNHSGGGGGDSENSTSGVNMPYWNSPTGRTTGKPGSSVLKSLPIAGDMASAKGKQDQSNFLDILRNTLGPGGKLIMDTVFGPSGNTNPVTGEPSTQKKKAPINQILDSIFGTGEQLPPIEDRPPPISTSKFPPKNDNNSATFTDKIGGGSGSLGNPNPPPQDIGIPSTPKIPTGEIAKGVFYDPDDIATRKYPPAPQLAADLAAVRQGLENDGYDVYFVINSGGQTPVGGKVAGGGEYTEVFGNRRTASGTENHDIKQAGTTLAVDFKVFDSAGNELTEEQNPEIWQSMSKYAVIAGFTQVGVGTSEIGSTITHFGKDPKEGVGARTWAYISGQTASKENLPQSVKDGLAEGATYIRTSPDSGLYQTLLQQANSSISGAPIPYQRGGTQTPVPDEEIIDMGSGTWTDRVRDPVAPLSNNISSRSANNLAVDPKLQEVMKNFSDVGSMPSFNEMNSKFNSEVGSSVTRTADPIAEEFQTNRPLPPNYSPSEDAYPSVKPNPNEAVGDMADELRQSQAGSSTFTDRIGNSGAVTSSSGSVDDIPWPGQEDQTLSALPYADAAEQFRQERAGSGTFTDRISDPAQRLAVDPNPPANRATGMDMAQQLRLSQQQGSGTFTDRIFIPPPSPVTGEPQPPVINGVPIEDGKEIPVNMNELMGSEESGIDAYRTPTGIPSSSSALKTNSVNTVPINPTTGMPYPGSSTFSDKLTTPAPESTGFMPNLNPLDPTSIIGKPFHDMWGPAFEPLEQREQARIQNSTAESKGFIPPPEQQGSATFTDKIGGQTIPDPANLNDPKRQQAIVYTMLGEEFVKNPDGSINEEGMIGVVSTLRNRATAGVIPGVGKYPSDPVEVALQPGQYSTWNDITGYNNGKGGNQKRIQEEFPVGSPEYNKALELARLTFAGMVPDPTFGATHYHTPAVTPDWMNDPRINKYGGHQVGNHIFYPQQNPTRMVGSQVTGMIPGVGDMANASVPLPRSDPRRPVTNMSPIGTSPSYDSVQGFMSPLSRSSDIGSMPSYSSVSSGFMSSPEKSTYVEPTSTWTSNPITNAGGSSTFTDRIDSPTTKGSGYEDKSTYVNEPSSSSTPKSGTSTTSKGTSSEPEKSTYVESSGFMSGPSSPASSTTSKGSSSSSTTKSTSSSSTTSSKTSTSSSTANKGATTSGSQKVTSSSGSTITVDQRNAFGGY